MKLTSNKINILFRFETGNFNGLGHAKRCIELAEFIKKKYRTNIFFCTNNQTKKYIKIRGIKFFFKKRTETEEIFLDRISKTSGKKILFIDNNFNYKKTIINKINRRFEKIIFYENFSNGIQKNNIIINPSIKKKIKKERYSNIYSSPKYLIFPKNKKYKKQNYLSITFGGSDPKNISTKILHHLKKIKWNSKTFLHVGKAFKKKLILRQTDLPSNIKIIDFDKKILLKSSLVICSPGVTAYELIYNQIFSIYISHTINHKRLGFCLEKTFKYSKNLDVIKKLNLKYFEKELNFYWKKRNVKRNVLNKKILYHKSLNEVCKLIFTKRLTIFKK